jgi:hypothetical protein
VRAAGVEAVGMVVSMIRAQCGLIHAFSASMGMRIFIRQ